MKKLSKVRKKELKIPKHTPCPDCDGSRSCARRRGNLLRTAAERGELRYSQGFLAIKRNCPACGGTGKRIIKRCAHCRGEKLIRSEHNVKLKIPAGITDESRLRIRGEGEIGFYGGADGDLYIKINVEEPSFIQNAKEKTFTARYR